MNISQNKQEIQMRIEAGESVRMIASSLGVYHSTLSAAMKKEGIRVPTKAESAANTWKNHKHPHLGKRGPASYMYGRHPKKESIEKTRAANIGPNNRHWCGGRKRHSGVYILTYAPDHPNRDRNGFVLEHRLVMEKHLGRILESSEIVHHINGDKSDNRIENLELTDRAKHAQIHMNEIIGGIKHAQSLRIHGEANR